MSVEVPNYYAEEIETPHPLRPSLGQAPQKLSSMIRHQGFREQLAAIDDRAEYEENALAAAHIILSQVREALWYVEPYEFEKFGIEGDVVSLAELPEKQVARCFGFTVVGSECLEMTGIDHWIGFANGHSTLLLPTDEGVRLNMADPLSPVLSQDLRHSMVTGGSKDHTVNDDMAEFGRSAIELNSLSLAARARGNTVKLLGEHTWLMFKRGEVPDQFAHERTAEGLVLGGDAVGQTVHPSRARIFMSVFLPEEGRRMLHGYDEFRKAYSEGELLDAAGILYNKVGTAYPDLDARQSHAKVKAITRELARIGSANYARKLLDQYFRSFELMAEDSRVPEAHADCLTAVAREAGDVQAANEAAEIYEVVLRSYPKAYKEAVQGKLDKVVRLAATLSIVPQSAS